MVELTDVERHCYNEQYALTTDNEGRTVLVGLTYEETEILIEHRRKFAQNIRERDPDKKKYAAALDSKHEKVRYEVIGAMAALQNNAPSRH